MSELEKEKLIKPFRLTQLAEYGPSAIVSRSIKKSEPGNITFFAFSKGEQLSPHSAPFDAFLQVLEGKTEVMIGEEKYQMAVGDGVVMPANIPHAVSATEDMKMLLVMIRDQETAG